jgi:N-methylhydantoinase A
MIKLGIDTGGTFTDFVLHTGDSIQVYKTLSTPDDPGRAILKGLSHFFPSLPNDLEVIHGTTVGTNAFLERKGAKTVLITTHGFEDVLVIGRQNRPELYNINVARPPAIIPSTMITGVKERMRYDGSINVALGKTVGKRLASYCRQKNAESVAVCLLHSYANDSHEQQIKQQLQKLHIPVILSSEILPEFREYERLTTTLINAYLTPVIAAYINRLSQKLGKIPLFIQQSNGGMLQAKNIAERSIYTLLSGPAGGVNGAHRLAAAMGLDKIITFDMGGTSTDVSLIDKSPTLTRDQIIDGYPVRIQMLDIHTVGAGGGSLVRIDAGGLLQVGPESAGADPGPICYGKGDQLTVTDANLYLGRLLEDNFLGGEMRLDRRKIEKYMADIAQHLSLDTHSTALGVVRIVNASMTKAIRAVSLERGHDPKEFVLFCFGGASGLHCCELSRELGIRKIVVPARAGILSAQGMVFSEPTVDFMQSLFLSGETFDNDILTKEIEDLTRKGLSEVASLFQDSHDEQMLDCRTQCFLNMRYKGQSYELTIPFEHDFYELFHQAHDHAFGYRLDDKPLEMTSIQCIITMKRQQLKLPKEKRSLSVTSGPDHYTKVWFAEGEKEIPIHIVRSLVPGKRLVGPALLVDDYTTVLLTPDFSLEVDGLCNLVLQAK